MNWAGGGLGAWEDRGLQGALAAPKAGQRQVGCLLQAQSAASRPAPVPVPRSEQLRKAGYTPSVEYVTEFEYIGKVGNCARPPAAGHATRNFLKKVHAALASQA